MRDRMFGALPIGLMASLLATSALAQIAGPASGSGVATTTGKAPGAQSVAANTNSSAVAEVIVTAQRRSENLERTPVAVSVLSGAALAKDAITSQSDLQAAVPGLLVKASQNSNQLNFAIRGQSVDAFSTVRPGVLPYVNDVQVDSGGASGLYDLQSVQVLKGPQGTLFGRNDTGGAVLFTTALPTNNFGGYVDVRGGDYSLLHVDGAVNVPLIDDKLLLRLSALYETRDGYQYNLYDDSRVGDVRRTGARVSLTFKPIAHLSNDLVIDLQHSGGSSVSGVLYNIYPPGFNNAPVPANVLFTPAANALFGPGGFATYLAAHPGADPNGIVAFGAEQRARGPFLIDVDASNFHRADDLVLSNVTKYDVAPNLEVKNIFGFTHLNSNDGGDFDGSPYDVDNIGPDGRQQTNIQVSDELQLLGKAFANRLTYVTGLYYSHEETDERAQSLIVDLAPFIPVTNQINDGVTEDDSYAIYGQGTYDLSELTGIRGLGFTGGVRYTTETVQFTHVGDDLFLATPNPAFVNPQSATFDEPSWQVGVQEQLNPNLLLYVVSRHSFRSGGFNFFDPPIPGLGNNGGSEYAPEKATDVEVGSKYSGRVLTIPARLNVAVYNLWINNAQRVTYVDILGAPSGVTVNVPESEITGVESDGVISPTRWLSVGGSLNYTEARFTSNLVSVQGAPPTAFGPYPDVPQWSGDLFGEVTIPIRGSISAVLHGDVYGQTSTVFTSTEGSVNPGAITPAYAIANFRVGIQDSEHGWSVTANLKNAFDHVYYVGGLAFGSLFTLNTAVPGDPRTITVDLRKTF